MPKLIIAEATDLYTIDDASSLIGISRMTLSRWLKAKKIFALRLSNRVFIPKIEIERLRRKVCSTCYYNQDSLCTCRETEDIITKKCPDWLPSQISEVKKEKTKAQLRHQLIHIENRPCAIQGCPTPFEERQIHRLINGGAYIESNVQVLCFTHHHWAHPTARG